MTDDMQPYERLASLTVRFTTEVVLDSWLWRSLYEFGSGDIPDSAQVVEVTDLWAVSPEGYADTDIALIARLADGQWATCVAWSDTTGFGCQEGVDWRINSTRELAISQGLDRESRLHLGLALSGEGTTR
ncbi:hypothetical protein ACGFZR_15520 [Streptomyces sp. NPDC048241]|uniref:hypothetical protein n=1 Tax=Streptomyces sp. NPDC048241 TaxID=3365521 RepID=UPI0037218622